MAKESTLYKCNKCGNIVSVLSANEGTLVCCNDEMKEIPVITGNEGLEKHKPVMEKDGGFIIVNVGSVDHPMEEDHYIQVIQILHNNKIIKEKRLYPGERPRVRFWCKYDINELKARAYCNKHGLWEN